MKRFIIFLGIISLSFATSIDPGIQAVCKITTSDGNSYEGFITLINGGYDGMHPNGFYFYQNEHYKWISLYDLEFNKLEKINETKYGFGNFSPDAKHIYFIAHTYGGDTYSSKESKKLFTDSTGQHLIDKIEISHQYKMFDSIPLFKELPSDLHLNYNDKELLRQKIAMHEIISIEVIENPSEKWLQEIEQKRKTYLTEINNDDYSGDYQEPIWAHDLLKDSETLNIIKSRFKEWNGK